ncbi:MAG: DNA polymerase III subunit gamma/tau [Clostridia bacterium]|nr:DNA polymerase III subunit gamma/tau [Clostridia bacterium]
MAYMALYRKFRPLKFSQVVGQEHVEKTLKNQIKNQRIGHAYLFTGGRGCGKTSTAKILSRAVNCLSPVDGEPCNECEICKSALAGTLVDITEMDAASNNGVDNIRDIREEVEFIPTSAKYRVYIIDEVHMLSTGAFNALLKTLEEPPAHVIFILATTEPQKLPATIISRCQRFDFKRITVSDIMKNIKYICDSSNIQIEEEAQRLIANLSDGAMRDAISILDRCVSDGESIITEQKIRELAGVPQFNYLVNMTKAIVTGNSEDALKIVRELLDEGKDLNVFLWELIKFQRDISIYYVDKSLLDYSEKQLEEIQSLTKLSNQTLYLSLISKLSDVQSSIKWSTEQEILFEASIIKLCLENNKSGIGESGKGQTPINVIASVKEEMANVNSDLKDRVLTILKENEKMRIQADLITTTIEYKDDGIVHIIFNDVLNPVSKSNFQKEETKIAIKQAVQKAMGKEVSVKYDNFK